MRETLKIAMAAVGVLLVVFAVVTTVGLYTSANRPQQGLPTPTDPAPAPAPQAPLAPPQPQPADRDLAPATAGSGITVDQIRQDMKSPHPRERVPDRPAAAAPAIPPPERAVATDTHTTKQLLDEALRRAARRDFRAAHQSTDQAWQQAVPGWSDPTTPLTVDRLIGDLERVTRAPPRTLTNRDLVLIIAPPLALLVFVACWFARRHRETEEHGRAQMNQVIRCLQQLEAVLADKFSAQPEDLDLPPDRDGGHGPLPPVSGGPTEARPAARTHTGTAEAVDVLGTIRAAFGALYQQAQQLHTDECAAILKEKKTEWARLLGGGSGSRSGLACLVERGRRLRGFLEDRLVIPLLRAYPEATRNLRTHIRDLKATFIDPLDRAKKAFESGPFAECDPPEQIGPDPETAFLQCQRNGLSHQVAVDRYIARLGEQGQQAQDRYRQGLDAAARRNSVPDIEGLQQSWRRLVTAETSPLLKLIYDIEHVSTDPSDEVGVNQWVKTQGDAFLEELAEILGIQFIAPESGETFSEREHENLGAIQDSHVTPGSIARTVHRGIKVEDSVVRRALVQVARQ